MHDVDRTQLLLLAALLLLTGCRTTLSPAVDRELEAKIETIIAPKKARIGVGVVWNHRVIAAVNDDCGYPLMSVMKFHQALTVADVLSRSGTSLDTMILIARDELNPDTWSPLRDRYPLGDKELSVCELLGYTLQQSDNNACDILFRRFGGPEAVDRCIRSLGFDCFAIAVTEEEMHTDPACCYANRSAPSEMALLLDRFVDRAPFATEYRDFIVRTMLACTTGTDRLPAGLANTEAVIGHKTGTGDRNERGERIGFNDAGFVRMPDGEWYTITVFIRDSAQEEAETHAPLRKFRRRFSGISPA
ncbi:class A beta-lactamase [uncultured Alistipes sp.]|uniref:class A beta-lactamase n=1 Tax=uncultured Alistipes sp. TaxID=538949 RepID=UPI0025E48010|nr:class A beta-lactamase [uncultured Alistipes sp.]